MIKKRLISLGLVSVMTLSLTSPAFASVNEVENSNIINSIKASSSEITLFGNDSYKWRTETRYGSWTNLKTINVTEKDVKSYNTYVTTLSILLGVAGIMGSTPGAIPGLATSAASIFYTTPTAAIGTYQVQRRSFQKVKVNILTGAVSLYEQGYQFKLTHNGKSCTYSYKY